MHTDNGNELASTECRAAAGDWDALGNEEVGELIEGTRALLRDSM